MDRKLEDIESELLRLDRHTRANLAKTLLESLEDLSAEEYDQLWAEEADARYADFEAGRSRAIDGDEVFRRARTRNGSASK
jgi:putative addiction module component (TIGR02574 family)